RRLGLGFLWMVPRRAARDRRHQRSRAATDRHGLPPTRARPSAVGRLSPVVERVAAVAELVLLLVRLLLLSDLASDVPPAGAPARSDARGRARGTAAALGWNG